MRRLSSTSTWCCKRIWLAVGDRGEKPHVALANAMNVQATANTHPRWVTMMLLAGARCGPDGGSMPASPRGFPAACRPYPITSKILQWAGAVRQAAR